MLCRPSSIRICSISRRLGCTSSASGPRAGWHCAAEARLCALPLLARAWAGTGCLMDPMRLRPEARILVVALRRLGDVLLTTPLIRSLKRAFPAASIEALVFAGTEGILSGNPDLAGVMTIPERASIGQSVQLFRRLARRYDLALTTQTGDRPTALAVIAGRQSAGPRDANRFSATLKRLVLSRSYVADRTQHRIVDLLRLAELMGIAA